MQVATPSAAALGHLVTLVISSSRGLSERTARWKLASVTSRPDGELGVTDTALGARLIGAREGDEFTVNPDGGEAFEVCVLSVISSAGARR